MSKCKYCKKNRASNPSGLCGDCYEDIKADIFKQKGILEELGKQARLDMSDEERQQLLSKVSDAYNTLKEYKLLGIKNFKSDIVQPRNLIYEKLGLPVPDNDSFAAIKCSACGCTEVVINSYDEKQNAGCGAYLFWTLFIVVSIFTFFVFFFIALIVMIPLLAIALFIWSLRKRKHKVRNLCICKSCGHKWYI